MPNEIKILEALLERQGEGGPFNVAQYSGLANLLKHPAKKRNADALFMLVDGRTSSSVSVTKSRDLDEESLDDRMPSYEVETSTTTCNITNPEELLRMVNSLLGAGVSVSNRKDSTRSPALNDIQNTKAAMAAAYLRSAKVRLEQYEKGFPTIEISSGKNTFSSSDDKENLWKQVDIQYEQFKEQLWPSIDSAIKVLKGPSITDAPDDSADLIKYCFLRHPKKENNNTKTAIASSESASISHSALLFTPQGLYDFCTDQPSACDALDVLDKIHKAAFEGIPCAASKEKKITDEGIKQLEKAAAQRVNEMISAKTEILAARLITQFLEEPEKIIQILNFLNNVEKPLSTLSAFRDSLRKKIEALLFPYLDENIAQEWELYVLQKKEPLPSPKKRYALVVKLNEDVSHSKKTTNQVTVTLFRNSTIIPLKNSTVTLNTEDLKPLLSVEHGLLPNVYKIRRKIGKVLFGKKADSRHLSGRVDATLLLETAEQQKIILCKERVLADVQSTVQDMSVNLVDLLKQLAEKPQLTGRVLSELGKDLLFQDGEDTESIQSIVRCFKRYHQYCVASHSFDTVDERESTVTSVPFTPTKGFRTITPQNSAVRSTFVSSGSLKNVVEECVSEETHLGPDSERTLRKIAAVLVEIPENQEVWDLFCDIDKELYQLPQSRINLITQLLKTLKEKTTTSPLLWSQIIDFIAKQVWVLLGESNQKDFQTAKKNAALVASLATLLEPMQIVWTQYKNNMRGLEADRVRYTENNVHDIMKYCWDILPDTEEGLSKAVDLFNQYSQAVRDEVFQGWIKSGMQGPVFKIHLWQKLTHPHLTWRDDNEGVISVLCIGLPNTAPDDLWGLMSAFAKAMKSTDKTNLLNQLMDKVLSSDEHNPEERQRKIGKIMEVMLACGNASCNQLQRIFKASTETVPNKSLANQSKELLLNYWKEIVNSEEAKIQETNSRSVFSPQSGAMTLAPRSSGKKSLNASYLSISALLSASSSSSASAIDLSLSKSYDENRNTELRGWREEDETEENESLNVFPDVAFANNTGQSISWDKNADIVVMMELLNDCPAGFEQGFKAWHEHYLIRETDDNVFLTAFECADTEDKKRVILETKRVVPKKFEETPLRLYAPADFMEVSGAKIQDFYTEVGSFKREIAEGKKNQKIWVHRLQPKTESLQVKYIDSMLLMQKDVNEGEWKKLLRDYIRSQPLAVSRDYEQTLDVKMSVTEQRNTIYSVLHRGGEKAQWAFDVLMEKSSIDALRGHYYAYEQQSAMVDVFDNILRAIFVANPVKCMLQLLTDPDRQYQWKFFDERIHLMTHCSLSDETQTEKELRWADRAIFEEASEDKKYPGLSNKGLELVPPESDDENRKGIAYHCRKAVNDSDSLSIKSKYETQVCLKANITNETELRLRAIYRDIHFESEFHTNYERMQYYYPDISSSNTLFGAAYRFFCLPIYWACKSASVSVKSVYGVPVYSSGKNNSIAKDSSSKRKESANDDSTYLQSSHGSNDNSIDVPENKPANSGCLSSIGKLFCGMFYYSSANSKKTNVYVDDNRLANQNTHPV